MFRRILRSLSSHLKQHKSGHYERSLWKSRIIATLAKANVLVNGAVMSSEGWLGKFATNANIVKRGMWVVQNLGGEELTDEEVDDLIK
ncbi:hypothetical protein [uncultured Neisseria sp.]|uniref:hypothetical protein n=1 Tax=uncultured Neisseria sp. TaxID=237778 RepID=UPI0025E19CEF|nr:hypothetical protein [uncultured Neisseria sp.]